MHNKRLYKKLMTILDWIIILIPLIVLLFNMLGNIYSKMTTGNFTHINDAFSLTNNILFNPNFIFINNFKLYQVFGNLISYLIVGNYNINVLQMPFVQFICYYCSWICILVIINMVRDLLLLIPTWFNDMSKK